MKTNALTDIPCAVSRSQGEAEKTAVDAKNGSVFDGAQKALTETDQALPRPLPKEGNK